MQAVILAAGEGTRLRPLTNDVPKCLLRVGKRTILEHSISQLPGEVDEVVIVVGRFKDKIKGAFGNYFQGHPIRYIEQKERRGTGDALFMCRDVLRERFLVMMGDDIYLRRDVENCLKHSLCILAHRLESPERFGVLKVENGVLKDIVESQKISAGSLINCGLYILDRKIFDYSLVPITDTEYGLPQTIVKMASDYPVTIETATFWMPVNTLMDLKQADKYLRKIYS